MAGAGGTGTAGPGSGHHRYGAVHRRPFPHAELPPYLAVCDVYVTASLSDTNSISMLEGEAAGLPVLQRLDPVNANQVIEGDNGYLFNSAEELGLKLRKIKNMSREDLLALKDRTTRFVKNSRRGKTWPTTPFRFTMLSTRTG